jgi:hypothetical protein
MCNRCQVDGTDQLHQFMSCSTRSRSELIGGGRSRDTLLRLLLQAPLSPSPTWTHTHTHTHAHIIIIIINMGFDVY